VGGFFVAFLTGNDEPDASLVPARLGHAEEGPGELLEGPPGEAGVTFELAWWLVGFGV
jgi:hypothetical protein